VFLLAAWFQAFIAALTPVNGTITHAFARLGCRGMDRLAGLLTGNGGSKLPKTDVAFSC